MTKLQTLKKYIEENQARGIKHIRQVFNTGKMTDERVFYMLVFCILVPGGKATKTEEAVNKLKDLNYYFSSISNYRLYAILKPLIRFPKQKTARIIRLKRDWLRILPIIRQAYKTHAPSNVLRKKLMDRVLGLGPKASSHLLRNLGRTDISIIDTHILKYRRWFMPKGKTKILPSSYNNYLLLETNFIKWSKDKFNLEPVYLDYLIWCLESKNEIETFIY